MSTPINASAMSPAGKLGSVSGSQSLKDAAGIPLAQARRSLQLNGSLDLKIDISGISKKNLANAISAAVQGGKVDLNVSPAVFNARTSSRVGTEVEAVAKELNIKTDRKSVKQLIAEIGDKTANSKAGQVMLPDKLLNGLGAISLAALVSEGEGKLNALGIKSTYAFKGGELRVELKGGDKTGEKIEFAGKVTAASGDITGSIEGRVNSQGGTAAKVSVKTTGRDATAEAEASFSSIRGEPSVKVAANIGATFGNLLLKADVSLSNTGKGTAVGFNGTATVGPVTGGIEFRPGGETRLTGSVKATF